MASVTSQGINGESNGEEETVAVMILNAVSERTCGSARGRAASGRRARGAWLGHGASGAVDAGRHRMARSVAVAGGMLARAARLLGVGEQGACSAACWRAVESGGER
jgi:hypothetical protein